MDHDPTTCPACGASLLEDGEHLHGDMIVTYGPEVADNTGRAPLAFEVSG